MPDRIEDGPAIDVLAEIFDTVHVQSANISRLEIPFHTAAEVEQARNVAIYIVLQGRLCVEVGKERVTVGEGDVFCLPRGNPHILGWEGYGRQQDGATFEVPVAKLSECPREGSGCLLRGRCSFADPEKNPLLGVLPEIIHVPSSQWSGVRWLQPTIEMLIREAHGQKPGAASVVNRVLELLLVQLVRAHITTTQTASHGWLRALSDAQIGGALGMIHEKPASTFTVAGLAHAVGMSRSAFASQFTRLVGEPPLHYVARWRMLKAAQLLKDNKLTLAEIAASVGYESEAAFSKAFKRWSGQAPGCYRRDRRSFESSAPPQALAG
jgi:AraC-like DNA-binding protein